MAAFDWILLSLEMLRFKRKSSILLSVAAFVCLILIRCAIRSTHHLQTAKESSWTARELDNTTVGIFALLKIRSDEDLKRLQATSGALFSACGHFKRFVLRAFVHNEKHSFLANKQRMHELEEVLSRELRACSRKSTEVKFTLTKIRNPQETGSMNSAMTAAYLEEDLDYYMIIASIYSNPQPVYELIRILKQKTSSYASLVVGGETSHPSNVGRIGHKELPVTWSLFTKMHYEIFGWFVPRVTKDLQSAMVILTRLYESEGRCFGADGSVWNSTKPIGTDSRITAEVQKHAGILNRYSSVANGSGCLWCDQRKSLPSYHVISMSLYGSNPRYTMGAIRNAQLFPVIFPGWRLWIFCEKPGANGTLRYGRVPEAVVKKLIQLGAEIQYVDTSRTSKTKLAPMMWRFSVVDDTRVEVFIVRDCDSRLTLRDAAVVTDWLKTGKIFHCIRDHPSHSKHPISGGLWGARRLPFKQLFKETNLVSQMRKYGTRYLEDMKFLRQVVWPKVAPFALCHDSVSCRKFNSSFPFPVRRNNYEHVGQVFDQNSIARRQDEIILRRSGAHPGCEPPPSVATGTKARSPGTTKSKNYTSSDPRTNNRI